MAQESNQLIAAVLPDGFPDAAAVTDAVLSQVLMTYQMEAQRRSVLAEAPGRVTDAARPYLQLGGDIQALHDAVDAAAASTGA